MAVNKKSSDTPLDRFWGLTVLTSLYNVAVSMQSHAITIQKLHNFSECFLQTIVSYLLLLLNSVMFVAKMTKLLHTRAHMHSKYGHSVKSCCFNSILYVLLPTPGSRDRAGRAVVEVYGGRKAWASSQLSPHEFCRLLLYLHSIPRYQTETSLLSHHRRTVKDMEQQPNTERCETASFRRVCA